MNPRISKSLIRIESSNAPAMSGSTASTMAWVVRVRTSTPAALIRAIACSMQALAGAPAIAHPAVSRNANRRGFRAEGARLGPSSPGQPGSPPARTAIS
jgi:hypothetical protein